MAEARNERRRAGQSCGCTRRDLLRGSISAAMGMAAFGGVGPFARLARGAGPEAPETFYIFCYFSGGWDILVGLDPRDPVRFNSGNMRETRIQPGYEMLQGTDGRPITSGNITFGPYIGDLANHANKMAVVRGMSMETLAHEAGRRRFITGKPPSGLLARGSSAATWLASKLGQSALIPNLAVDVESYNVDQPNYATGLKANGVADLLRALRPANALDARQERQIDELLTRAAACDGAKRSSMWQAAEGGRLKAKEMSAGRVDTLFDFAANTPEIEAIRQRYGIAAGGGNALNTPEANAALAAQAITSGVSRAVSITVTSGLDTHFQEWATVQGPRQQRGFNAIARIVDDLSSREFRGTGTSWMDHTVIVGFSEFSRTALLNVRGGRDHALTNACFVLGAGIRGGTVIGASSDMGLGPQPINLETGRVDMGGQVPKPEHVLQTLFYTAGISRDDLDTVDLRVPPIRAMMRT